MAIRLIRQLLEMFRNYARDPGATAYALAMASHVRPQTINGYLRKSAKARYPRIDVLCRIRYALDQRARSQGKEFTWEQMGKLMDEQWLK